MDAIKDFLDRLQSLSVWKRSGKRAAHKPILILYALGRVFAGDDCIRFAECRQELSKLLREFSATSLRQQPEYPFWRLQNDRIWEVIPQSIPSRRSNSDPTARSLVMAQATGMFPAIILKALKDDRTLVHRAARTVLSSHFADTIHDEILNAVGLPSGDAGDIFPYRSTAFRRDVLRAYRYSCAVCSLSLRLDDSTIGLDAAHIKWRQAQGPDVVSNGLALCISHHKLFDLGTFTITPALTILVSDRVSGSSHVADLLLGYHKRSISATTHPAFRPQPQFMKWHREHVFRESPLP
jgi:putative restriction endonuclease